MLLRDLYEQDRKIAVIAFGRLNPPTIGHAKLVDKIKSIPGDHYLFLSHTQKPKTDPLDFNVKLKYAQQFFPGIKIGHPAVKTPVLALEYLQGQGYTDVIFVAGSDRVEGFQKLFDTYNGIPDKTGKIPFKFNSIRVVSAGERDPDADDVSGMSASKMRLAAAAGELEAFAQGVPDKRLAKSMYDAVRAGMGVKDQPAESRSLTPQTTPLQALVMEYLTFTSTGIMTIVSDGAKSPASAGELKKVFQTLTQSFKNLQPVANDKKQLEANRDKILKHIHDMMTYAIAHLKEHMIPQEFDSKKKQINSVLTKYNNAASTTENFLENEVNYLSPNFDYEWEEAERYPEFRKIGKEAWIELAGKGKAVIIKSAKGINNTDAEDPDSFTSLDKTKQGRALDQLKSGTVEMPIIAVYSDGWKELVGGNTRLTAMLAQNGEATVWAFKVPDEIAELAENFINSNLVENNKSIIDNVNGWGAVPNNQEVNYLGLKTKMSPETFILLAAPLDAEPSNKILQHIQDGGKIGSPFLRIEIPESWEDGDFSVPAKVVGHEGRNRMFAVKKALGNDPIEVHLFFSQGLRNRHITDDFKKHLNDSLVKEKSNTIIKGPLFSTTIGENFADGKNPGRKGLSKRMGVNTKASVSSLRKTAKNSSGEKQRMAHWLANMKAGRAKKK